MNNYEHIQLLINAIQTDSDESLKRQKLALINKLLEAACKYITIVTQQSIQLQINQGTTDRVILEMLADMDKSRSRIHDSLIGQIAAINRLCVANGLEPIYSGSDDRREKGDFAMQLIADYFKERL